MKSSKNVIIMCSEDFSYAFNEHSSREKIKIYKACSGMSKKKVTIHIHQSIRLQKINMNKKCKSTYCIYISYLNIQVYTFSPSHSFCRKQIKCSSLK